ncbi:MAG: hypothetical protein ABSG95_14240 [Solirubrobacteraceae bacterium]|jgi:predicted ATP-grasp superfamily ATP-dependent carboligase
MKWPAGTSREGIEKDVKILIFALARSAFHHGALGIARSAGRLGIPVYRLSKERSAPASLSRYSRERPRLPEHATTTEILAALRAFNREHGRALLVPIDDVSAMFLDDHAGELEDAFLFPAQPSGLARALASKREMYRLCLEHDIPTPAAAFPESESDVVEHAGHAVFPVVAKRIDASAPASPQAPSVFIAQDRNELLDAYRLMESPQSPNVMLQEYIPGTLAMTWMFNGYFDADSECRIGFTAQKLRQAPPYTGATTLGVCLPNPTVDQTTKRLMKAVGYRGILDIGYRLDQRDGRYKLLDVNPRIGGSFRLFVGADGMDVLRALYLDITGQEVPVSAPQPGRRWVVEPLDLASSLAYWRRGDLTVGEWARSFRGVREAAWFAADDPLPFLALWGRLLLDWLPHRLLER